MTTALSSAVELLDRSLAYTRVALAEVEDLPAATPTPCRGWTLAQLLAHMDDGLDAYTQAASGRVLLAPSGRSRLDLIRGRACALLGWWLENADRDTVVLGDHELAADVLVGAAALEITLHGWDLHATAGHPVPVPDRLAGPLLVVAAAHQHERMPCWGAPLAPATDTEPDRLLGRLGRGT